MERSWRNGEKGGSRLKTLAVIVILFVMVFSAIKIVPIYVANYELHDKMQEEATYATITRKSADAIRSDLAKKLKDLNLPIDPASIQVSADQGNVQISVDYTVPVDLAVYQLELHFHPQAYNASL